MNLLKPKATHTQKKRELIFPHGNMILPHGSLTRTKDVGPTNYSCEGNHVEIKYFHIIWKYQFPKTKKKKRTQQNIFE